MPVFPKRRFQHGALPAGEARRRLPLRRGRLPLALPVAVRVSLAPGSAYPADAAGPRPLDPRAPPANETALDPAPRRTPLCVEQEPDRDGDGRARRRRLPDEPRVPVALPDVRPLEEHAGGAGPGGRDPGADPRGARGAPAGARRVKLYNAGSFFDPRAIPPGDFAAIAALARPFARVIVECAPGARRRRLPALPGSDRRAARGRDGPRDGPSRTSFRSLNKRMTLARVRRAPRRSSRPRRFALPRLRPRRAPLARGGGGRSMAARAVDRLRVRPRRDGGLDHPDASRQRRARRARAADGLFAPPRLAVLEDGARLRPLARAGAASSPTSGTSSASRRAPPASRRGARVSPR